MQYSVHPPNEFICRYWNHLLPEWSVPVRSLVVVMQPAPVALVDHTPEVEAHKQQLRDRFVTIALAMVEHLKRLGHAADAFDPRTGFPLVSQAGALRMDDVAVVRSTLGFETHSCGACSTVIHPMWGSAVYPSIVVSSAETSCVVSALRGSCTTGCTLGTSSRAGWSVEGLLEYHHSFKG